MRNFMTSTLVVILALAGIAATADAANFTNTTIGISMDVDDALSQEPRVRDLLYFKSKDKSASLMIKQIHDLSIVDFLTELRKAGYRSNRDGVFLSIIGKLNEADIKSGRGLLMPVRGVIQGQQTIGVIGAYSGHDGQGFLVIGAAKPEHWATWKPRMKTMFNSVRFVKFNREAQIKDWEKRLLGKKLQYKTANAIGAPPLEFHLCSKGAVTRLPGAASQLPAQNITSGMNQRRGKWRIIVQEGAPYLIVHDGREHELMLEDEGENFLMNGRPATIAASDLCK